MSRFVVAYFREDLTKAETEFFSHGLEAVGKRIGPKKGQQKVVIRISDKRVFSLLVSQANTVLSTEHSIAVGHIEGYCKSHEKCGFPAPEGTFALIRWNDDEIELVADAFATRTIWYFSDRHKLFASSSQRALIMLLRSFVPNPETATWMLTNGHMGPSLGWDMRLARVAPRTIVSFSRTDWSPVVKKESLSLNTWIKDKNWHISNFAQTVTKGIQRLPLNRGSWLLPLSGGHDSRLLAIVLEGKHGVQTITWGCDSEENNAGKDARIARRVSDSLGFIHEYAPITPHWEIWEECLKYFVEMSEGRTDNFLAYIDGFQLWDRLVSRGITCIIRGDEPFGGFGWYPVYSERETRAGLGLIFMDESPATSWIAETTNLSHSLPDYLKRKDSESLEDWRFRLYCEFRVPVALAALTETESAYVDAVKPLQYRRVLTSLCHTPRTLRRDKKILISLVKRLGPNIEFGSTREGDQLLRVLRSDHTLSVLRRDLCSDYAYSVLPKAFLSEVIARLSVYDNNANAKQQSYFLRSLDQWLRASIPHAIKRYLKRFVPEYSLDPCLLAFRTWLVVKTHQLFEEDANVLNKT